MTGMLPDEYMTRIEFAKRVGLSVSEIRRREGIGRLKPAKYVGRQPYYAPQQIEEQKKLTGSHRVDTAAVQAAAGRQMFTGQEAAIVYEELDKGASLKDVVKITKVHPDAVMAIAASWQRIQGGMFVRAEVKAQIDALPLDGCFPLQTDEDLLDVLKQCAADTCVKCQKKPRSSSCPACTVRAAKRMESEDV